MQFLADVELVCDDCKGTRYKPALLEIKYRDLNVHEVLYLSIREAMNLFSISRSYSISFGYLMKSDLVIYD